MDKVGTYPLKLVFSASRWLGVILLSWPLMGCSVIRDFIGQMAPESTFSAKVSFVTTSITMSEGGAAIAAVTLSNTRDTDTVINVAFNASVNDGTNDFSGVSHQVVIPAGTVATTLSLSTIDDAIYEGSERFELILTPDASDVGIDKNVLEINLNDNDNPPVITFSTATQNINENAGSGTITAQLSHLSALPVRVAYSISMNGATTADFTLAAGEVVFPALSNSQNISFTIIDDAIPEAVEEFTVTLSTITGSATLGSPSAHTVRIIDNETAFITIDDVTVTEGGTLSFTASLSAAVGTNVTFDWTTVNGTAIAGTDYTAASGSETIIAGATTKTIQVVTTNTAGICEADRSLTVVLSNIVGVNNGDDTGAGTITDDDLPSLSIADNSATEGSDVVITATLSAACATKTVTFNWSNSAGTATATTDYGAVTNQAATITAGNTTTNLTTTTVNDAIDENDETFTVSLSSLTNATAGTTTATGTIVDNDNAPSISIANVAGAEAGGSLSFTVSKTGSTSFDITVDYTTADGTASEPADYTSLTGTLTIAAAATTETIIVALANDSIAEDDETLTVTLSNAVNATIGTAGGTGTITNDDAPTITNISPTSGTNAGGTTITLTGTGFLANATATVGGVTCTSPTVVSGTSFTCVTPIGTAGAVDVVFSNAAGSQPSGTRSVTSTGGYTYIGNTWNFGHSGDFTYSASLFTTSQASNSATLTPPDLTTNSQTEFNAGTHSWTKYDNVNSKLTIDLGAGGSTEIDSSWTPQYASLIGYWNFNTGYNDSTANASVGTANGGVSLNTPGRFGPFMLTGDGGNGAFVEVADCARFYNQAQMSVAFWVKVLSKSNGAHMMAVGHNFIADTDEAFRISFDNSADQYLDVRLVDASSTHRVVSSAAPFPTNVWTHVAFTYDGANVKLYINSVLQGSTPMTGNIRNAYTTDSVLSILGSAPGHWGNLEASMDELGFWSKGLTAAEVLQLFSSTPVPYDPVYLSPVVDALQSGEWLSSNWITSLPYGKELPGDVTGDGTPDNEVPVAGVDYPALGGNLASGLVGLWHVNETSGTASDSSGKSNTGTYSGTPTYAVTGVFDKAIRFASGSQRMSVAHGATVAITGNISVMAWVNRTTTQNSYPTIVGKSSTGSDFAYVLNYDGTGSAVRFLIGDNAGNYDIASAPAPGTGAWHQVVGVADASWVYIYVDGVEKAKVARTIATMGNPSSRPLCIGAFSDNGNCNSGRYTGDLDEIALWNRDLAAAEVLQLYRRGINNVQFQYRACLLSDCSDNPAWKGPDNTSSTWFSEAHNMTAVTSTGSGSGTIKLVSPLITFANWITAVAGWSFTNDPARYFQYKAKLTSTDLNPICGGSACLPDLLSMRLTPVVSISTAIGLTFPSALSAFSVTRTGDCGTDDTVRFQVSSNDGTTYKYWNGTAWTTVNSLTSYAQGATLTATNANIATLASSGTLRFRALVPSQHGNTCVLSNPSIAW